MKTLFDSRRYFKIWKYLVSHKQLLLRSVPTDLELCRVEVLFRNVYALKTTTELDTFTIRDPSSKESLEIEQELGADIFELALHAFVIESTSFKGYVVASDVSMAEDEGDYKTQSSLLIGE